MGCSTPGFPVHHKLLELAQTHVHQISDTIQQFDVFLTQSYIQVNAIKMFSPKLMLRANISRGSEQAFMSNYICTAYNYIVLFTGKSRDNK